MDVEISQEAQAAFWRVYNETLDSDLERRTEAGLRAAFALLPAPVFVLTDEVVTAAAFVSETRETVHAAAEAAGFRVEER